MATAHGLKISGTFLLLFAAALVASPHRAMADEGGVSLWLPGTFGSFAAAPLTQGWSLATVYYHTDIGASGAVAASRAVQVGRFNPNLSVNLNLDLNARADLVALAPTYVFDTKIFGGQLVASLMGVYARQTANIDATVIGALGPFGFGTTRSIADSLTGFGDLYPQISLRWNQGVHNFMIYGFGNIPVGSYEASRLTNIGIGHWAIDGGAGYTYLDPTKGHEFSIVGGVTNNFRNTHTDYRNGVDYHIDWGASQFLSKQFYIGAVGYYYDQFTADSGAPAFLGEVKSRVLGVGPQMGFLFPVGDMQGALNFKAYFESNASHRPDGWNAWVTFVVSPEAKTPGANRKPVALK
jgi:hypothetical protein